jgi:hypothetical protein
MLVQRKRDRFSYDLGVCVVMLMALMKGPDGYQ